MAFDLGHIDEYVRSHRAELQQEAELERLASLVVRSRRPVRSRIANWLVDLAEWVDGRQVARAQA